MVTPNPKYRLSPNRYYIENPVNKSKVKVDKCRRCKTQEKVRARVACVTDETKPRGLVSSVTQARLKSDTKIHFYTPKQ